MPDMKSPSCPSPFNQAAIMTSTAVPPSDLEHYPTTVTNGDKPSLEGKPSPPSTVSISQDLNMLDGDETMIPQPATGFQSTASPEDNEFSIIKSSAAETSVQDVAGTVESKKSERGGDVEIEGAVELELMLFPRLPTELMLKIWKHALPGPRVVEMEWNLDTEQWFCPFESQSERSSLPRTNRESRELYHRNYIPTAKVSRVITEPIVWNTPDPFHETSQHTISYFDSTIDILYIGPCSNYYWGFSISTGTFKALAASPWMQKVCLLAIDYNYWSNSREREVAGIEEIDYLILSMLPNLTEFILVLGDIPCESLRSDDEEWVSRPHAEIEFIDAEDPSIPPWVDAMVSSYNKEFPRGDGLKFSMKKILRGGVIPESIGGPRQHTFFSSDPDWL